jgi:hypothetical protein
MRWAEHGGAHGRGIPTELYLEFVKAKCQQGENCERFVIVLMKMICMHASKRMVSGIGSHKISSICPAHIYGATDRRQPALHQFQNLSEVF